jgi:hypothetical protein
MAVAYVAQAVHAEAAARHESRDSTHPRTRIGHLRHSHSPAAVSEKSAPTTGETRALCEHWAVQ